MMTGELAEPGEVLISDTVHAQVMVDGHAETRNACWVNFYAGAEHWNKQGEFSVPVVLGGPCNP